jgi:hypothetical protein
MNCLQACAIAAAALVASGEPLLQPLIDAPAHLARGEALLRDAAETLEAHLNARQGRGYTLLAPDAHIHAARVL